MWRGWWNGGDCVVGLYNEAVSGESAVYLNAEYAYTVTHTRKWRTLLTI